MNHSLSTNAKAILLLTAPLVAGRGTPSLKLLTLGEYKRLARFLLNQQQEPADLLGPDAQALVAQCQSVVDGERLEKLLARGFLLTQALERWQARAIWVVSRADIEYPKRLKMRLKDDAPPVLYGCGDASVLATQGLAVVGSRDADQAEIEYAERVGRLAAQARCMIFSGGARGIDQAAMRGALEAEGTVTAVLADGLERAALNREHRNLLLQGRLVLVSPYDPSARFNVGNAMQRNKLIYALADAALVVSSDHDKGGTWTGAVEQLEKLRLVPVYVRATGESRKGLEALRQKGALPWPEPTTPEALGDLLAVESIQRKERTQGDSLPFQVKEASAPGSWKGPEQVENKADSEQRQVPAIDPAEELFSKVRELLTGITTAKTDSDVARELRVSRSQAKAWLKRLVEEGVLLRKTRPVRYCAVSSQPSLFGKKGRGA